MSTLNCNKESNLTVRLAFDESKEDSKRIDLRRERERKGEEGKMYFDEKSIGGWLIGEGRMNEGIVMPSRSSSSSSSSSSTGKKERRIAIDSGSSRLSSAEKVKRSKIRQISLTSFQSILSSVLKPTQLPLEAQRQVIVVVLDVAQTCGEDHWQTRQAERRRRRRSKGKENIHWWETSVRSNILLSLSSPKYRTQKTQDREEHSTLFSDQEQWNSLGEKTLAVKSKLDEEREREREDVTWRRRDEECSWPISSRVIFSYVNEHDMMIVILHRFRTRAT